MKIEEFSFEKFYELLSKNPRLQREYHSDVYHKSFPLKGEHVIKIEPIEREKVRDILPGFINGLNHPTGNLSSHSLNFNPNEYYLYGAWVPKDRFQTSYKNIHQTPLNIRFRTKANDRITDDFLESMQEVSLIRYCCNSQSLEEKIDDDFKKIYEKTVNDNRHLIDNPKQSFIYIPRGMRILWIEDIFKQIFYSISIMQTQRYSLDEIVNLIENIDLPSNKKENDILWNSAIKNLKMFCK